MFLIIALILFILLLFVVLQIRFWILSKENYINSNHSIISRKKNKN